MTRQDQINVKALLNDPRWESVEKLRIAFEEKWYAEGVKGNSEFETLWNVAYKEGVLFGVKNFLEMLEKEVYA